MYVIHACINNAFVLFKKTTKLDIGIKKFTIYLRNYCYFKALKNATSQIQQVQCGIVKKNKDERLSCYGH